MSEITPPAPSTATLEAAATAALGGPPTRPPGIRTQPIGGNVLRQPAARAPQPGRKAAAGSHTTGNPTFDAALPPDLAERRQKVATVRGRLSSLITHIAQEHSGLLPLIADLEDDAATLKAAEMFDPAAARKFLNDLQAIVSALSSTKPGKPEAKP